MEITKYLYLFRPVSEGLPELTEVTYWYNDNNERVVWEGNNVAILPAIDSKKGLIKAKLDRHGKWSEIASGYIGPADVTHYLDLDRLTTIERAEDAMHGLLAEMDPYIQYTEDESDHEEIDKIIPKLKSNL